MNRKLAFQGHLFHSAEDISVVFVGNGWHIELVVVYIDLYDIYQKWSPWFIWRERVHLSTDHTNTNHCNFQNIVGGSNASLSHG